MSPVVLSPAVAHDRQDVHKWLSDPDSRIWLGDYDPYWLPDANHIPPAEWVLIAREDGVPVGFANLVDEPEENLPGTFFCICVAPHARGRGVGRAIIEALDGYPLPFAALAGTVAAEHPHSTKMLQDCGYQPAGFDQDGYAIYRRERPKGAQ